MTTTRSATEIWLIGNPKPDLNTTFLLTNGYGDVFRIFKNQNSAINDVVKRTIEAVTEICVFAKLVFISKSAICRNKR